MATHTSAASRKSTRKNTAKPADTAPAKDALSLLKSDHRKVEELFEKFSSAKRADRKQKIAKQICAELTMHALIEEEDFYPAVREALRKDSHLIDEAEVEHETLKILISQIEDESPTAEFYDARVHVLREYVKHHVQEEEKEIFPKVRKSELDTRALGRELQTAKEALQQHWRH